MLFSGMLLGPLFVLILMLLGLFEFILCSAIMCAVIRFSRIRGIVIMWNEKKWFSVVLLIM